MVDNFDPAGPAALVAAATGRRPLWAEAEEPREWKDRIAYDYVTSFSGHDVIRELSALAETGWRVQIKASTRRQVRITLYREDK